ncbi:MAG: hypothetical protein R6U27_04365 [Desulfobacterales bacterium]
MLIKPQNRMFQKNTNKVEEMPLCRPFRTQKLVMAFPVVVTTGFTTVPLQGTKIGFIRWLLLTVLRPFPFREPKSALPVAVATGYTPVPLQGTKIGFTGGCCRRLCDRSPSGDQGTSKTYIRAGTAEQNPL